VRGVQTKPATGLVQG